MKLVASALSLDDHDRCNRVRSALLAVNAFQVIATGRSPLFTALSAARPGDRANGACPCEPLSIWWVGWGSDL